MHSNQLDLPDPEWDKYEWSAEDVRLMHEMNGVADVSTTDVNERTDDDTDSDD